MPIIPCSHLVQPKATIQGVVAAVVTLGLLTIFFFSIVMTDMPRAMMRSHDAHGRVVAFAFMIGLFLPVICFVRSVVWISRTFPLPSRLVWLRFLGGGIGGIVGAYASGAAAGTWFGLGPPVFVAVGLALPPLLCCLGETMVTRRAMMRGRGSAAAS